ncbi:MAG: NADH dehydrogenase chloroplastic mitochondrial-like [Trebouxia sp. A1-2]|nr:MAG: NADH dehydrogenase chloroplastic mitochondrial-like [Trebouxia sp. A1-2]
MSLAVSLWLEGSSSPRICILGGGFGGLYTAVRLESLMWPHSRRPQITLIDQNEQFVFKPLLYELINGGATPEEVAPMFADLLAPMNSTSFVQALNLLQIQGRQKYCCLCSGGTITLADGQRLQYDWLVLALGSSTSFFGIPGVKDLALPFNDFKDAMKVLRRVEDIETRLAGEPAGVVVVGAGYAGVELASTVAERLGRRAAVQLVSAGGDILEGMPPGQVKAARSMLQDLRVTIVTNAMVSSISEDQQQSSSAEASTSYSPASRPAKQQVHVKLPGNIKNTIPADMVLWTAGSSPASHAARKLDLPFETNQKGALLTDRNLRVLKQQRVFALGDVAGSEIEAETANIPPTAQVAFQQADYVAWNLWSAINSRPLLPFKYQHLGDMMSLGRVNGAVTLPLPVSQQLASGLQSGPLSSLLGAAGISLQPDATGKGLTLQGPLAGFVRRAAYLYRQPTDQHKLRVGRDWLQQAAEEAQRMLSGSRPN